MLNLLQVKSLNTKLPKDNDNNVFINVLTWHDQTHPYGSKYHTLSPYYLKTDGNEEQFNQVGIIFENFWQGSKLWPTIYDTQIYAHHNLRNNPKHLWFKYICENGSEQHLINNVIQPKYFEWRSSIFNCNKPIRYPNGFKRTWQVAFTLLVDKHNNQSRLDYIEARHRLYIQEYCRLIKKLDEYKQILNLFLDNKSITICEVDVINFDHVTLDMLEKLSFNRNIKFGHGMCIAMQILKDTSILLE